jgi:arylsulfatase A-like enzyme
VKLRLLFVALIATLLGKPLHAAPPNIVMIVSDDHAWTDYGFMGHPHIHTPHLDKLAAQSLTFKRGYVPSSLCSPSLASLITGKYPHQHKITGNDPPQPAGLSNREFYASEAFKQGRERMNAHMRAVPTLPKLLAQNGYLSLQTGKWWQGDFSQGGFTHGMTKGGRHGDAGLEIGRKTMQPIYDFIGEAQAKQKPFFVWYAPLLPHDPHTPPQELFEKYSKLTPSPHIARYWAMVEWFDQSCGALLKHLDDEKLSENTIVVYVADNGWIQNPNTPRYAPKSKQSPYDGGLRTPIMIRYPAKIKAQISDVPMSSLDIFPTLLQLTGIAAPPDAPGINLTDTEKLTARRAIYGEIFLHTALDLDNPARNLRWRWILQDDMKLLVPTALEKEAAPELYDLKNDPHETKNLALEKPQTVQQLTAALDAWWKP